MDYDDAPEDAPEDELTAEEVAADALASWRAAKDAGPSEQSMRPTRRVQRRAANAGWRSPALKPNISLRCVGRESMADRFRRRPRKLPQTSGRLAKPRSRPRSRRPKGAIG